ncbi:MAG TPA: hypothetical protein VG870_09090 [Chitinophagaceae bacterium]|nr:hypothetical protein [Chitinophagaceae bacterium]
MRLRNQLSFLLAGGLTLALAFSGCYYDIKEQLYPATGTCDTSNISYSQTIVSILTHNGCLTCHGGSASAGGNISLDHYTGVKTYVDNGRLYGSISQQPGYIAMPLGGNKMSRCDLKKVSAWIRGGAVNN